MARQAKQFELKDNLYRLSAYQWLCIFSQIIANLTSDRATALELMGR